MILTNITNKGLLWFGTDEEGNEYPILGGNFFKGLTVDAKKHNTIENTFVIPQIDYENIQIFNKHFDKDGLIKMTKLVEVANKSKPGNRVYELDDFWVFPEYQISRQIEYLYENKLENIARFRISKNWKKYISRASVYSIDYIKLIQKLLRKPQTINSWFICEKEKDFDKGVYADLLIQGNYNEDQLQLQLWQVHGDGIEVQYAHALIEQEDLKFTHFDLATHIVDPEEITKLILHNKRMTISQKNKWLRLDGKIDETHIFELMKNFFIMDHLIEEFIEKPVPNML